MTCQSTPPDHTQCQCTHDDYEISILDILVVLAENIRFLITVPLIVGVIAFAITFLIPRNYESTALLRATADVQGVQGVQGGIADFKSQDLLREVLGSTDWINQTSLPEWQKLKKLDQAVSVSADKKDFTIVVKTSGPTPEKAQKLCMTLIDAFRANTLPKGRTLESINENIDITGKVIKDIELASKRIADNMAKVTPGTEGDNVTRAYINLITQVVTKKELLYSLKQQLKGFGSEIYIQTPTLPEKPSKPKVFQIVALSAVGSGFLTILFVFIRAAFHNLKEDAEVSEKLARIRKGLGLS